MWMSTRQLRQAICNVFKLLYIVCGQVVPVAKQTFCPFNYIEIILYRNFVRENRARALPTEVNF